MCIQMNNNQTETRNWNFYKYACKRHFQLQVAYLK